jgi:hypothetical protein
MRLKVNVEKTKIMVFRKGGFLGKRERWSFNNQTVEVVNKYNYLGYTFTTQLSTKLGIEQLVQKGKKSLLCLLRVFQKYKEMSASTFFKIFDAKIQPSLLYSAEIWGTHRFDRLERVHLLACKRFLGVTVKCPNKMVYGDLGRYPLFINTFVYAIRYWLRLVQLPSDRLSNQSYNMLLNLDANGKSCWVSNVREILCNAGFNFVWLQQGVGDVKLFLKVLKNRLVDMFIQEWEGVIRDKDRYSGYRSFKVIFEREKYISYMDVYCFRVALSQLRFNVLPINNNLKRYNENENEKRCPFCLTCVEDEYHFIYKCSMYGDIRQTYLKDLRIIPFQTFMHYKEKTHSMQMAKYIFYAFKRRSHLISIA